MHCHTPDWYAFAKAAFALAVGIGASNAWGQSFEVTLQQFLSSNPQVPGVVATVDSPIHRLEWSGAAGLAERASKRPATVTDAFHIASVTKPVVAAAVIRLDELGELNLDAPIASYVSPKTKSLLLGAGYDVNAILIRHLLSHTSGLRDYARTKAFFEAVHANPRRAWTRAQQIDLAMRDGPPLGKPGEVYDYSDTGYVVAGEIVERIRRVPLGVAVRALAGLDNLALRSTWWKLDEPDPSPLPSLMHEHLRDVDVHDSHPSIDLFGGGGIWSTTGDLVRIMRHLALGGAFTDRRMLLMAMNVPAAARTERAQIYAHMGQFSVIAGEVCWGHTGFWGTFSFYCPRSDTAIAVHYGYNQGPGGVPVSVRPLLEELMSRVRALRPQR
jgi:D-alanyl-D-alanine carboxypeptidase